MPTNTKQTSQEKQDRQGLGYDRNNFKGEVLASWPEEAAEQVVPATENGKDQQFDQKEDEHQQKPADDGVTSNWGEFAQRNGLPTIAESFDDMNLKEPLLRGIYSYGLEKPSAIQQRGILAVTTGKDVVAQAQSGTGKTVCFCVGTLQQIERELREPQVLVLCPTRELAGQIHMVVDALSQHMHGLSIHAGMGGVPLREDIRALNEGVHMLVGTPGRIIHLLNKGHLNLRHLKALVLDEADEMLARGFQEQMREVFNFVGKDAQICLFSATMPPELHETSRHFMNDPIRILVKDEEVTLEGIKQFYVLLERREWKFATLCDLYAFLSVNQSMIFCNRKEGFGGVDWLSERLQQEGHVVAAIHGGLSHDERRAVMAKFRAGEARVLVSTDLLARGLDVQGVSIVINFDLPYEKENYVHRIGRSGRFGKKGVAINFLVNDGRSDDVQKIQHLEKHYDTQVEELPNNVADYL